MIPYPIADWYLVLHVISTSIYLYINTRRMHDEHKPLISRFPCKVPAYSNIKKLLFLTKIWPFSQNVSSFGWKKSPKFIIMYTMSYYHYESLMLYTHVACSDNLSRKIYSLPRSVDIWQPIHTSVAHTTSAAVRQLNTSILIPAPKWTAPWR